jgi:hypothetical protein
LKDGEIVLKGSYEELKNSPYLLEVMAIHKQGISSQQQKQHNSPSEDDSAGAENSIQLDDNDADKLDENNSIIVEDED